MSYRTKHIVLCIICLSLGASLYIFFCPDTYISILFQKLFSIPVFEVKLSFRYYLSDFLWGLAFNFGLLSIFEPQKTVFLFLCCVIPVLIGIVWELLQYLEFINGTGDIIDIVMYLSASLLAVTTNRKERN